MASSGTVNTLLKELTQVDAMLSTSVGLDVGTVGRLAV